MMKKIKLLKQALLSAAVFTFAVSAFADIQVEDSHGMQTLPKTPQRVAALNWDIAEQVLELGVTPIVVPNIKEYSEWVVRPAVPESVEDIGTRMEPNLERLAELKPDVIIIASPQLGLQKKLEAIAPVLYFHTYNEDHNNAEAAIKNYRLMAKALGKEAYAEQRLAQMESQLDAMKEKLAAAYNNDFPKVISYRFADTKSIYLYGDNSIPQYALQRLGFEPAMPQPATQWGVTQKRVKELGRLPAETLALYYLPFEQQAELDKSNLWQAIPFVKAGNVAAVEPAWNYGGAMAILYNAEVLTNALLELAPK
ncbi:iron-siderophore ABC transporter substrate-binding protein [Reinekea thalattae]|uniref:Iron-siderophore ABC transporter substrate-binding protein n=1 Tax=Reinekea thalattae TaxID=2593301 RepID=A0A5C8ZAU5_9GAMM|nr:iron-siderophore ABC transporter substrate-binding protein [Reinekea thalattae]TXR54399.1 iron-siderophore ABC transporter substrate-binding protein [Reinekea thalattae]